MLKKIFHFSFVMAVICGICIFGVSLVFNITKDDIAQKESQKKKAALSIILGDLEVEPQAECFEYANKNYEIYIGKDKTTKEIQGWGIQVGEQGYSSVVQTMVGVDANYNIIAIEIIFQQETPGLGAECVSMGPKKLSSLWTQEETNVEKRPQFQAQFSGQNLETMQFQAMTGATITSTAVFRSVAKAIQIIRMYRQSKK